MHGRYKKKTGVKGGLICVLKSVEPCVSFDVRGNRDTGKLEVVIRERRCLFLYFYYQHKEFGFMHAWLQTWRYKFISMDVNG